MNKIIFISIYSLLLLSCTDGRMMRVYMEKTDSLNRNYVSLADDSVMPVVTAWMDRYGTPNERMRAHYLQAAVFRDRGQAPEALTALHTAAQCADTTASDCDYHTLSRVHAQMADLLVDEYLPKEALQEGLSCQYYAKIANDTLLWLVAKERSGMAFFLMGDTSSAISVVKDAYMLYKSYNYREAAQNCLETLLYYLVESENPTQASYYICQFENDPELFDAESFVQQHPTYLYIKGLYYSSVGKVDSALVSFYRLKDLNRSSSYEEMVYKGLYRAYRIKGNTDSVAKYASLCYEVSDLNFENSAKDDFRRMQAHYDYSRHRNMALQKAKEVSVLKLQIVVGIAFVVVLIVLMSCYAYVQIRKKKRQIEELTQRYQLQIKQIEESKKTIKDVGLDNFVSKLQKRVDDNLQGLCELLGIEYSASPVEMCDNEVYARFLDSATHPHIKINKSDWKRLTNLFNERIPNFRKSLTHGRPIHEKDLRLCMLLRMNFSVSEICVLLDTYSQYVSVRRSQLLKKYYNIEGKAEDFDKIVQMIN